MKLNTSNTHQQGHDDKPSREPIDTSETGKEETNKPTVLLPGNDRTINDSAAEFAELFNEHKIVFLRSGVPVMVKPGGRNGGIELEILLPVVATSEFECVAKLKKLNADGLPEAAICGESMAKRILVSRAFKSRLPAIDVVTRCPVLTELADGGLAQIAGYNGEKRILAAGHSLDEPARDEAVRLINLLLTDFNFATPGDKSRAIAALLTPAMVHGNLLGGRAPLDLGEADQSQSGKGYRNKLTCAIYNERPKIITLKKGGVGTLKEAISDALLKGHSFVVLDNIRGKIDCPMIESAMTEDTANARVPYGSNVDVETTGLNLMMTSNKAELTDDLANRTSCVRILKRPPGYTYQAFPEGDLLDHVRAHREKFLGAIFAVIRAWYDKGMPRTQESRHDFRGWAQRLDWIVQHIFDEAPLLDGHAEVRARMTNDTANWVRDLAFAVSQHDVLDRSLRTYELADILVSHGRVEIPGLTEDEDIEDEKTRSKVNQAIGRRMSRFFDDGDHRVIDGIEVVRTVVRDENYRDTKTYTFRRRVEGQVADVEEESLACTV